MEHGTNMCMCGDGWERATERTQATTVSPVVAEVDPTASRMAEAEVSTDEIPELVSSDSDSVHPLGAAGQQSASDDDDSEEDGDDTGL